MSLSRLAAHSRAALRLARAVACNRLGLLTRPSLMHFYATCRCNLRCQSCPMWEREPAPELDTADMLRVLGQLDFLDVVKVTGGEPFLRDDLDVIVDFIQRSSRPVLLQIISNGSLPDRMVDLVERHGNAQLSIRISLEGLGETHNRLRGQPWAFQRAWTAVEQLARRRRRRGFHLGINYNLCEETLADLPELMAFCGREHIDLVPGVAVFPFLQNCPADTSQRPLLADPQAFLAHYREIWRMSEGMLPWEVGQIRRQSLRAVEDLVLSRGSQAFPCRELRNLLVVMPTGDLVTCGLRQEPVVNLARERFVDVWSGPRLREARRVVDACAGCQQMSIKMASRLYSGEFI